ncbi:FliI/YscN family ATPase [Maritimibacter sp. UBA3975]|mgnify:CR=1 FL=1|uniref:FliI/YscN family ATPase n=1 Tax=Maritimibacter sp. UBA3975 TaxID=1946833 RepID=UPI000C0942E9|nr:FliI/YscN family ATPase [Maritimibacter sp. UBA3975]MAM61843.1 flagellum-specific ATP synthase FliI [Maritimibacter sp.]|tara:strand:+ start:11234 stop:12580 length:1347 start_codon:yes stop_codon:yes gene_type:complete
MPYIGFEHLDAEVRAIHPAHDIGRVDRIGRGTIEVSGLSHVAAQGDMVEIDTPGQDVRRGEVLGLGRDRVTVLPDGDIDGLQIGAAVTLVGQGRIAPDDSWIGRVVDPFGRALDNHPIFRGPTPRALRGSPPNPTARRALGDRLETGMRVFNTLLPIVRGQRIGLFAGSGVGKSTLLAKLARGIHADIVVIALIGERGREVREFVERVLGQEGMRRAVVVAATSDMSPLARRRCALTAMSVAEHFRDNGRHVLFLADSVTRFAEAHREIALAAGEASSLRGYPPSTAHQITALCERAGPGAGAAGDITAVFSVLVAGSDMEEPVADILRGVLDGHVVLDRQIAERGRFPAIDLLRSVSRALPGCASEAENTLISAARQRLGTYDRSAMMIQAGLYAHGSDPNLDTAIDSFPQLDAFLSQDEPEDVAASFRALAGCLMPEPAQEGTTSE